MSTYDNIGIDLINKEEGGDQRIIHNIFINTSYRYCHDDILSHENLNIIHDNQAINFCSFASVYIYEYTTSSCIECHSIAST